MTGYGSGALDEAALREGAADYVEKHLVGAHLERSIRYALRDWQASRAAPRSRRAAPPGAEDGSDRPARRRRRARLQQPADRDHRLHGHDRRADGRRRRARRARSQEIATPRIERAALTRQLLAFSRKQFLQSHRHRPQRTRRRAAAHAPAVDRRSHRDRRARWEPASAS